MTVFMRCILYSLWKLHKVNLYLNTSVTQTKIVLPNRVKNENIFDISTVKQFLRNKSEYSGQTGFFVHFGEISYLVINKENKNDQEPGLILTGNFIEKVVMDKNVGLK